MPDWNTHIKWAEKLGIDRQVADLINKLIDTPEEVLENDPTELGKIYRQNPALVRSLLISHDWGRKGKARLDILKRYCSQRFGEKGVMAAELHHLLDYITILRNPEKLAKIIISSSIFSSTRGKPIEERIRENQEKFREKENIERKKKITQELINQDYESYKEKIIQAIKKKAKEWNIHKEVLEFIMNNLDEILADIDAYLRRKHKRTARPPSTNTLDKWL